ncbi:MAG: flavodoxin family protein [Candidatus Heimdallarchaeaceae archaeon]
MNALIFNGALKGKNQLSTFQEILEEELENIGINPESIILNEVEIKSCIGCFKCWDTTPGICSGVKGDTAEEIKKKVVNCDLIVFLTPLTFGGYSSEIKKIVERMLGILQPGVTMKTGRSHHLKRYDRYPSILAIATTNKVNQEESKIFKHLMDRHSFNFYPPSHITEVFDISEDKTVVRERIEQLITELEVGK